MNRSLLSVSLLLANLVFFGCTSSSDTANNGSNDDGQDGGEVNTVKVEFPEGDPNVSAEDGGPGFTGEGWETSTADGAGDPNATKGGTLLTDHNDWPENLRPYGSGANTYLNSVIAESLLYETLLEMNENTLEFVPGLATHWKISEDKMTFSFRINPKAHWSDGKPVVADDMVATWKLLMDESLIDPMNLASAGKFEEPVAKSKYIVEVTCKEKDWRNFIFFGALMRILPAQDIGSLTGKEYKEKYNFNFTAVSGPYMVLPEDIKDNESITVTRRKDFWAMNEPRNIGRYNFDRIRWQIVRDRRLAFDKTCKGELDFHPIYTAAWWVDDIPNAEGYGKGHLIRQKVFTRYPEGFQGLALNMRKAPLDDINVRHALACCWNRREALDKFAYNEYDPLASYYPGDRSNPANQVVEYDLRKATELLAESGWTERGSDGILVKDGKRLSLVLTYSTKGLEKYFTSYKESLKKAGIEFNLQYMTHETLWKNVVEDRKFEMASMNWGAILFPSPRSNFHSMMADKPGSNNLTGLKSDEVDRIIEEYDKEFDHSRRTELLRELDGELFNSHHYVLAWWLPSQRVLYKNKFGMPEYVLPKYTDWRGAFSYWWADSEKAKALKDARKSGEKIRPVPAAEVRHWIGEDNVPSELN